MLVLKYKYFLILQPTSKDLIMKALEQARSNLPQKPAKSSKQADKGCLKREMFTANEDDTDTAAVSKPFSAAANKPASKAGKPNSTAALATGKKVEFMFCEVLHINYFFYICSILQLMILIESDTFCLVAVIIVHMFTLGLCNVSVQCC